jgi:hypothetical protein
MFWKMDYLCAMTIFPNPYLFVKSLILAVFILLSGISQAQTTDSVKRPVDSLKSNQFKAGIKLVGVGASYERKLAKAFTLYSEASVNFTTSSVLYTTYESDSNYGYTPSSFDTKEMYAWVPMITTEVRHYYNIKDRMEKRKNTSNNAFNLVSIGAGYVFNSQYSVDEMETGSSMIFYSTWGIQRSIARWLSLEVNVGPGVQKQINEKVIDFYIHANVKLDILLK